MNPLTKRSYLSTSCVLVIGFGIEDHGESESLVDIAKKSNIAELLS